MGSAAAVGIHDDLSAGKAAVALRAADDEAAGGVDIKLGVLIQQAIGHGGFDDQLDHILPDLIQRHLGSVLGRQYHGVYPDRLAILVILHRDLGLAIGPQIAHQSLLAHIGEALGHFLGNGDSQRHQLRCLVAGIAEHHALVAGAVVQLGITAGLGLQRLVHSHSDIAALLVDIGNNGAGIAVKTILCAVIADVQHHLPGNLGNVHIAVGGDLPHDVDQARGSTGLAGHAAIGILFQNGVQYRVGDLVTDLVRMSLSDGLRCE